MRVKDPRSGSPHRGALAPSNVLLSCKGSGNVGFSARRSPIQRLAGKPKVFSCSGLWVFPLHKQGFALANPAKLVLGWLAGWLRRVLYSEKIFGGREDYEEESIYTATRVRFPGPQLETLGGGGEADGSK